MEYTNESCARIAKVHPNIVITAWLRKNKAVAWHVAPGFPAPSADRHDIMGLQTEIIKSILKTNEEYFGKASYIMMSLENVDVFHFIGKEPDYGLSVVVKRPYDQDALVKGVLAKIS